MKLFIEVNNYLYYIVDRFKHKTILELIFIFIFICIFFDMIYYVCILFKLNGNKNQNFILKLFCNNIKIFSFIHSILLLILCYMSFIKLKIKTTLFY